MKKKLPLLLIPIIIIVAVTLKMRGTQVSQPEDGYLFSGVAEATEVRLSFKTSGRISSIFYDEGDLIEKNAVAAKLEDTDEKLNIYASKAKLDLSNATLAEVLAGSRKQEIRNAKAALDMANAALKKAEAELSLAKADKDRFEIMFREQTTSERSYEQYKTAYEKALHTYEETQAGRKKAQQTLSLVLEGARSEAIQKARASVSISEQEVLQAEQKLEYTTLSSPVSGTVLTRSAEPGEFVSTGSVILTVADLKDMWIRGFVSESYLGKVKLGQQVIIKSDSYPDKQYKGKITYISGEAEFTPKSVQTYDERVNFMYRIKVSVENPADELKLGMPVEGKILY